MTDDITTGRSRVPAPVATLDADVNPTPSDPATLISRGEIDHAARLLRTSQTDWIGNDQSDEEQLDRAQSDREQLDREQIDREQSDREKSDREQSEQIDREFEHATSHDAILLAWIRVAIERRNLGRAAELLDMLDNPDTAAARVLEGDLLLRNRRYNEHYDLVYSIVRSHRLTNLQLGTLALQTAELALLSANHSLADTLFGFARDLITDDPLLSARRAVGQAIAVQFASEPDPATVLTASSTAVTATGPIPSEPGTTWTTPGTRPNSPGNGAAIGSPAATLDAIAGELANIDLTHPAADAPLDRLRHGVDLLNRAGLADLAHRVTLLIAALRADNTSADLGPETLAHDPWVPTDLLYQRFEHCPDAEFDFWAQALEHRSMSSPHSSLVTETSDVVQWARSIYDQHQQNLALDRAIEQTRSGWRELANLTSNEIRGLLTSLGVAADLRRSGSSTPPGLELALVHRIAALTTMTQLGASEAPSEVEGPPETGASAAALLDDVIAGEQPIFDWAQRSLLFTNRLDDDLIIAVNPSAMSDMLRWLLLSATTGSLSAASIEIIATTGSDSDTIHPGIGADEAGDRYVTIEIRSRTPCPPEPERHRELGLGSQTTAYRAAVMLVRSWNGTFSAAYSTAGLDIMIRLPATIDSAALLD